jgi:hypothetical protein
MVEIRQNLKPLTEWIPPEFLGYLPVEAWWLVELVIVLAVLVLAGHLLRAILRGLLRWPRRNIDWDRKLREDLESCPLANGPPAACVYHVPAKLRLIVVAPGGKGVLVDAMTLLQQLDLAVPGLGTLVAHDHPRVALWPAQLSTMGFTNSFHRCTPTGIGEGEASEWIFLAGRVQHAGQTLFLGLALWGEQATTLGRMNLETHQWLDILRLSVGRAS